MKNLILIASLALTVAACADSTSKQMQDGEQTSTPPQWTEYCQENPHDEAC